MNTLYVRIVLTFVVTVLIGLISAFFITITLFRDDIVNGLKKEIMTNTLDTADLLEQYGLEEAGLVLNRLPGFQNYTISVVDSSGQTRLLSVMDEKIGPFNNRKVVQSVLAGNPYNSELSDNGIVAGVPFQLEGKQYALFVHLTGNHWTNIFRKMLFNALIIVLLVGSIIIFIAARYLVKPLREMKVAVESMARGEFDIQLKWKSKDDELGQLAKSFSHMSREIKQMEEMRRDFVSSVSHEIQSPLTSISGFSKTLLRGGIAEEDSKRYLQIIQNESERLSRLGDNLLKLASLDSEQHPFELSTYDLDEQIRQIVVAFEPQWSSKSIDIEMDLPNAKIVADEDLLSQVWMNLIGNCIKFTPEGGSIFVDVTVGTHLLEVTVADTGIGISPEDIDHVFDRFYKADKSRNKKQAGNGLGLSITKRIVLLHGGMITMAARQGGGTIATVTLPSLPRKRKAVQA